jgi:hypothetical protein
MIKLSTVAEAFEKIGGMPAKELINAIKIMMQKNPQATFKQAPNLMNAYGKSVGIPGGIGAKDPVKFIQGLLAKQGSASLTFEEDAYIRGFMSKAAAMDDSRILDYLAQLAPGVGSAALGAARGSEGNRIMPAIAGGLGGIAGNIGGGAAGALMGGAPGGLAGALIGGAELGRKGSMIGRGKATETPRLDRFKDSVSGAAEAGLTKADQLRDKLRDLIQQVRD